MYKYYLGIDPGLNGGIACVYEDKKLHVVDMIQTKTQWQRD